MDAQASQLARLRLILEISRQLAITDDLDVLLNMIVTAACQALACERATVFLYDPRRNVLWSRVATGASGLCVPADRGIAAAAASSRQVINVNDAYADPRFNPEVDRQTGFRTRNLLAVPLENLSGELMGVLQALNRHQGAFDAADEELARVLGAQAGVALHRWQLLQEYAEKQRMARDLEIARRIQQGLFPRQNPQVPGYDIAGWNRCADETGGDCYDFVALGAGRLAVLLADATGHGIGAALVMTQCRAFFRAMLSVTADLAAIVERVNELLMRDLTPERFITAFFGILDPRRHELSYVSAGQGPLLFACADQIRFYAASALPLAVSEKAAYRVQRLSFASGDRLVLLTDGFYEATDAKGELFGQQRVADQVRAHGDSGASELIERLYEEIREFSGRESPADDLTALVIRRVR
jgi:sigma-B regulation protein RsbU (phosphoserine phosphatase)